MLYSDTGNSTLDLSESDHQDFEAILERTIPNAPDGLKHLMQSQLKNYQKDKNPKARRWDPQMISICLSLWCRSEQGYKDFRDTGLLALPSGRLLQYYKNSVKQTPGICEDNLKWMHTEANHQLLNEDGRHGGLVIDEMTIQDDLQVCVIKGH